MHDTLCQTQLGIVHDIPPLTCTMPHNTNKKSAIIPQTPSLSAPAQNLYHAFLVTVLFKGTRELKAAPADVNGLTAGSCPWQMLHGLIMRLPHVTPVLVRPIVFLVAAWRNMQFGSQQFINSGVLLRDNNSHTLLTGI